MAVATQTMTDEQRKSVPVERHAGRVAAAPA
jgi:hypothetical protein